MNKVIIFGVGDNYHEYELWIRRFYEIVGFVDSNKDIQGKKLCGLTIKSPDSLFVSEYDYILITPNVYPEIVEDLISKGIENEKVLILHEIMLPSQIKSELRICFVISGGLGDNIIAINYIYNWALKYKTQNCILDIYCYNGAHLIKEIGDLSRNIDNIKRYQGKEILMEQYDLVIGIRRYPIIIKSDDYLVSKIAPNIVEYILLCMKFRIFNPLFFIPGLESDGLSAIFEIDNGRRRISQPDIYGDVLKNEECSFPVIINDELLNNYGLMKKKYITIHRGCDKQNFSESSVKLWAEKKYEDLIIRLKKRYSNYEIVLIGEEYERSDIIVSQDIDLVGKTDFESLKTILYNAVLHIDTEGGLVHLRHAVKGGSSVVLFGPTNPCFFGYSENINLRTNACPEPCEWKTPEWACHCQNIDAPHVCMESITVDIVMDAVENTELER